MFHVEHFDDVLWGEGQAFFLSYGAKDGHRVGLPLPIGGGFA